MKQVQPLLFAGLPSFETPRMITALGLRTSFLLVAFLALFTSASFANGIDPFVGSYAGTAEVGEGEETTPRSMNVDIAATKDGFTVAWTTFTHKANGRVKEKNYTINFIQTSRKGIFSSGMKSNLFGNKVPLNPIHGDPYVWSHITGKTFTVYALHILEDGGYEMQEYHRTLTDGGLDLDYRRISHGEKMKTIRAFLKRN